MKELRRIKIILINYIFLAGFLFLFSQCRPNCLQWEKKSELVFLSVKQQYLADSSPYYFLSPILSNYLDTADIDLLANSQMKWQIDSLSAIDKSKIKISLMDFFYKTHFEDALVISKTAIFFYPEKEFHFDNESSNCADFQYLLAFLVNDQAPQNNSANFKWHRIGAKWFLRTSISSL